MTRLDRYIFRELFGPFFVGTVVVVMLFQANAYIYIAKMFNLDNIPVLARAQWIMYETPYYLKMALPIGMALATALALTRLTRESELTALRAGGTSMARVILPVIAFGVAVSCLNFYVVDRVVPVALRKANEIERKNEYLGMAALFQPNKLLQVGNYAAAIGGLTKQSDGSMTIQDVLLIERDAPQRCSIVVAKAGKYDRGVWSFVRPMTFEFDGEDIAAIKPDDRMVIDQQVSIDKLFSAGQLGGSEEEEPTPELQSEITRLRQVHADPRAAEVELNDRFAVPASCAIFAITGAVFAIMFGRTGGFAGVLVTFFVLLLYYNAYLVCNQTLGKIEAVPAWLAAWLPNILFGGIGVGVLMRLE